MNIQDRKKTLTAEDLRRRYNLDDLNKDRKAIRFQTDQTTKIEAELNNFIDATAKNFQELQDQVDGNVTTWFFSGIPTLQNKPASDWATDEEKANHLGDLYYDQETGYAYRWIYKDNEYKWLKLVDSDVVEALALANSAKDTADSKRRVFVVQPIPPYDIGDIWIKEDQELYRCRASRSEGNYSVTDWIIATKYTDDTVALETKAELDQFKVTVDQEYTSKSLLETTVGSVNARVEEVYTYTTTVDNQVGELEQKITDNYYTKVETDTNISVETGKIINTVSTLETRTKIDADTNAQNIAQLKQALSKLQQTAQDLAISITSINTIGVNKVITETGYVFDKEGLKISKTGEELTSLIDNVGLYVKRNNDNVLKADATGVEAENITVRTFFVKANLTREESFFDDFFMEECIAEFWVGD